MEPSGGAPGSGDGGPGHRRPDAPGLRGGSFAGPESRLGGPRQLRPQRGATSLLKGASGKSCSYFWVCFSPTPLLSRLKGLC